MDGTGCGHLNDNVLRPTALSLFTYLDDARTMAERVGRLWRTTVLLGLPVMACR